MLTGEIRDNLLVDELQLGSELNQAVHNGFSSQFSLLVSMLSDDVQDQAWVKDPVVQEKQTEDLREQFALQEPVRLQSEDSDIAKADMLGDYFRQGGMVAVHLLECLSPEPLTLRHPEIPRTVMEQLSPLQQEKIKYENTKGRLVRNPLTAVTPVEMLELVSESRGEEDKRVEFVA